MKPATWTLLAALACSGTTGCVGQIGEPGEAPGDGGNRRDGATADAPVVYGPELPAPASRYPRLSHEQWESTTQMLLGLPANSGLADAFINDARTGTFDNNGSELRVGAVLWADYQRSAEALAATATATPAALARVVPAGLPTDPVMRARAFVAAFGQRAFRRPLVTAEVDRYAALFARGLELHPELTDPVAAGARMVIKAMLQSPHFLYRVERTTQRDGDVLLPNAWEIATRLSYALWNTMPDAELFRAAAAGELVRPDAVRVQVRRMLMDDRARETVRSFHDQLLDVGHYADVTRPVAVFPEFSPELRTSMVEETREFVAHVVFDRNKGLRDLLTAPYTFVDARLARVYGLTGTFDDSFRRVDLDPGRRAGLLTMVGFLATNAQGVDTDPIHRGVFINRRVLCAPLPAPPADVPPLPPPAGRLTMRQRITMHTGTGTCGQGCHSTMINPAGFAFEHYDALGRWRDTDNTLPVDATGEYSFERVIRAYDGGPAFAREAAQQPMSHRCYVRHWLEYAYARPPADSDQPLVLRISDASLRDDLPMREVLTELVTSRAFLTRATQEAGM